MNTSHLVTSILCVLLLIWEVSSFPTGAPLNACMTLDPSSSHGASTAAGPPPYKLTFSSGTYRPGDVIQVTLSGAEFKGFLIVGRKEVDSTRSNVGLFQPPSSPDAKLLCTGLQEGNGVTHTNNTVKSSMTFNWKAPAKAVGDIVFHFTVVRGGAPSTQSMPSDYYMDLKSSPLKLASDNKSTEVEILKEPLSVSVVVISHEEEEEVVYAIPARKNYPYQQ